MWKTDTPNLTRFVSLDIETVKDGEDLRGFAFVLRGEGASLAVLLEPHEFAELADDIERIRSAAGV